LPYNQTKQTEYFRSIFLSDFHIGAKTFNAAALLDFLRHTESETLYLVGDIIDGWKLNKRWYWNETISEIFDELFRKAHDGTKIIYITGNHDENVRKLSFLTRLRYARRLNIQIRNRIIHTCADGRDFLVLHGDQFDRAILSGTVSRISDRIYDFFVDWAHRRKPLNIEVDGTVKRFSLSKFLSYRGQMALNILNNYEAAVAREAQRSDVSGIICGHTHVPAHKRIGTILYANCGSWLKNAKTAVIERLDGKIDLIEWDHTNDAPHPAFSFMENGVPPFKTRSDSARFRPMTERLIASIRRTWPSPHDASAKGRETDLWNSAPGYTVQA
jgi:UDP-2,3-diacylglucosamine pyrophosphatase LpxH